MSAEPVSADPRRTVEPPEGSFDAVYAAHFRRVVAAMKLSGFDQAEAEDLAQEAFARTFGGWSRISAGTNAPGYVYRVAFRLSRRRRKPDTVQHESESSMGDSSRSDAMIIQGMTLREALASLPRRQRECVLLTLYAGFTSEEAGKILHIRAPTVRVHVATARKALVAALDGA